MYTRGGGVPPPHYPRTEVKISLTYTNSYIRGLRLAEIDDGTATRQYTFNAHGDVTEAKGNGSQGDGSIVLTNRGKNDKIMSR